MLPYFDIIFKYLKQSNSAVKQAFSDNVHWGYFENYDGKEISPADFNYAGKMMIHKVLEFGDIKNGDKVLDVGCGFGGMIGYLNENYHNCRLVGVNIDVRQLAVAKKAVAPKNGNKIEFLEADALLLPFISSDFDVVLCVESVFHFASREKFLAECRRVLKTGGRLIISDFVPIKLLGGLLDFLGKKFGLVKEYGQTNIDISLSRYNRIGRANGLQLEASEDISRQTFPTYKFLRKNFHLIAEAREFNRATAIIEFVSRVGILKYLVLSFKKNG